jgi:ribosomal-protein-alanine N-acetyltransferase
MFEFSSLCSENIDGIMSIESLLFAEESWSEQQVESQLANPRCLNQGVSTSKGLVGFAFVSCVLDEAELYQIAILPEVQGRGVATALLHEVIKRLEALGVIRLMLEVRESNVAAIRLYESFGFVLDGRRKGYYSLSKGREDALLYSYHLS